MNVIHKWSQSEVYQNDLNSRFDSFSHENAYCWGLTRKRLFVLFSIDILDLITIMRQIKAREQLAIPDDGK